MRVGSGVVVSLLIAAQSREVLSTTFVPGVGSDRFFSGAASLTPRDGRLGRITTTLVEPNTKVFLGDQALAKVGGLMQKMREHIVVDHTVGAGPDLMLMPNESLALAKWSAHFANLPESDRAIAVSIAIRVGAAAQQEHVSESGLAQMIESYCERHRGYHDIRHLDHVLREIESMTHLSVQDMNVRKIAAVVHDAVYVVSKEPTVKSSEAMSYDLYVRALAPGCQPNPMIKAAIMATEKSRPLPDRPENSVARDLWKADNKIPIVGSLAEKRAWSEGVKREYLGVFGPVAYYDTKSGRPGFLLNYARHVDQETMALYSDDPAEQADMLQRFVADIEVLYQDIHQEVQSLVSAGDLSEQEQLGLDKVLREWPAFKAE